MVGGDEVDGGDEGCEGGDGGRGSGGKAGAVAGGSGRLGGGDAYGKGGQSICRQPSSVAAGSPEPPAFRMTAIDSVVDDLERYFETLPQICQRPRAGSPSSLMWICLDIDVSNDSSSGMRW